MKNLLKNLFLFINMLFVTSCSNENKVEQIYYDIHLLNVKVEQINNDIELLKSDLQLSKDEFVKFNQRLNEINNN